MVETTMHLSAEHLLTTARQVLQVEANAILNLHAHLSPTFVRAVELVLQSKGRVIVTGIGKSGHIARKIAATLASTGTPAYFVHAAEAAHGDLGMITAEDVVIAISHSGRSDEILMIIPLIKRRGSKLICLTGDADSPMAQQADVFLDGHVDQEACPLNLAPTASTTAALALGDALAIALLEARGFNSQDFAYSHPGGALGRRLLTLVRDVMRPRLMVASIFEEDSVSKALLAMTRGGLGMTAIVDHTDQVKGIFTDGDLRRVLEGDKDIRTLKMSDIMTKTPHCVAEDTLAAQAALVMEQKAITVVLVTDQAHHLLGAVSAHDLMRHKVI